jgi:hypothetical protein
LQKLRKSCVPSKSAAASRILPRPGAGGTRDVQDSRRRRPESI